MADELFGNIMWDDGRRLSSGIMTLATGETVRFTLDGYGPVESVTEAARNTINFIVANEPLVRHKIAVSLLGLYREWNDGKTIPPEELGRKLNLKEIAFLDEGGGELCYTAGDLFTGHWVCVQFDASGEIGEPELEG